MFLPYISFIIAFTALECVNDHQKQNNAYIFTPQPLRAVVVLFSPMADGRATGKSLSGLYLRNRKV